MLLIGEAKELTILLVWVQIPLSAAVTPFFCYSKGFMRSASRPYGQEK